jgi:addiction module RelE/StbE family toxin
MAVKIVWTNLAKSDRKDIFTYWNTRNSSKLYSKKLNDLFNKHIETLINHPRIGKQTNYRNIRFLIVRDYLIFYEQSEKIISIIRIWDSRRDPDKIDESIRI